MDFKSTKELADYLIKVGNDETLYHKYFEWKKYLKYEKNPPKQAYLCEMCIKLNLEERSGIVETKRLNNMKKNYGVKNNCKGLSKNFTFVTGQNVMTAAIASREEPDTSVFLNQ